MAGIKLTVTGDIEIANNEFSLVRGTEAKGQHLAQRFRLFLGEWFLDTSRGIPYHQQIFIKNPNPVIVDSIFKREIIQTPGFKKLNEFSLDLDTPTRVLSLDMRGQVDKGEINFKELTLP